VKVSVIAVCSVFCYFKSNIFFCNFTGNETNILLITMAITTFKNSKS
jgi:hypothetical protein